MATHFEVERREERNRKDMEMSGHLLFPIPLPSLLSWLSFHRFSLMTATLFRLVSLCERRERSEWRDEGMECKDEAREARGNGVGDGRRKATWQRSITFPPSSSLLQRVAWERVWGNGGERRRWDGGLSRCFVNCPPLCLFSLCQALYLLVKAWHVCGLVSERNGDDPHTRTNEVSEIAHGSDPTGKRRWGVTGERVKWGETSEKSRGKRHRGLPWNEEMNDTKEGKSDSGASPDGRSLLLLYSQASETKRLGQGNVNDGGERHDRPFPSYLSLWDATEGRALTH